jgi:signal transduction histidine kinase
MATPGPDLIDTAADPRLALERECAHMRQLALILESQEHERSALAYELHEEVAQALAAVLLGLDAIARELPAETPAANLDALRVQVQSTLDLCRRLAVDLRPPVLDGVGLVPALERLAELPGVERVAVDPRLAGAGLSPETETGVYRAVEEALRGVPAPCEAVLTLEPGRCELRLFVRSPSGQPVEGELGRLQARLDVLGGRLESSRGGLEARIPVTPGAAAA